mgnify:CR=1 FL=1
MKGYRKLRVGERMREGDKYYDGSSVLLFVGDKVNSEDEVYRRIKRKPRKGKVLGAEQWWGLYDSKGELFAIKKYSVEFPLLRSEWTLKRVNIVEAK